MAATPEARVKKQIREWLDAAGCVVSTPIGSAYGAAGSIVVLLVWVYYSALIFFFGAEFTHAWATRHQAVAPQPHAMPGAAPQTKSDAATASES